MCDIDYFKAYNDTCGHQQGDDSLKKVADTLSRITNRAGDLVARYGGEEFAIILPDTNAKDAEVLAEKMRVAVESMDIAHSASRACEWLTVSLGVATTVPDQVESSAMLISAADQALYHAKAEGRNRTKVAKPAST